MTPEMTALAEQVFATARGKNIMLATAESCTGGLVFATLTAIAGSSAVAERGFITYTNAAKTEMLGVPENLIKAHGAVSSEVATAMAQGALTHSPATMAISITGIAGPGGSTPTKPVGLVYIACAHKNGVRVVENKFTGTRTQVREQATYAALTLLMEEIKKC